MNPFLNPPACQSPSIKSMLTCRLRPWLIFALVLFCFFSGSGFARAENLLPSRDQEKQCIAIVKALEKNHYLGQRVDDRISSRIFDIYLKRLDPSHSLFTARDLARLNPFRSRLDNDLVQGNLEVAFDIFNLYQSRAEKRLKFILARVNTWETGIDLASGEKITIDNEDRPWQPSVQALETLWKKDLVNHIITLKLDDKENKEITKTLKKIYSSRLSRLSQTNANDAFQLFMNSVTASFDPHTQYFPPRVSEDFDIQMSLSLEGIGAVLQNEYEYTKVIRLIPKGPADKSNLLMPGDKIIGVGQGKSGEIKDTIGQRIDRVVKLIRGPKNTFVRLKIIPAKKTNSTATISIKRDKVKLEEQSAKKQLVNVEENGKTYKIGIIEVPNFYIDFAAFHRGDKNYKSTTTDVKRLLKELKNEKIDGLVVDLRNNGGGSLKEASDLTGLFLKYGPTVQIKTKYRISRLYDDDADIAYTGPLLVLINRMSASASEIFAGAIKDYHRGIIVGTQSFGKGTVQELAPLGQGKLKLTSAKFYRVSGESTQHRGVEPDIALPRIYRPESTGESSLDGALPWDTIIKSRYRAYPALPHAFYGLLARQYQKRAANDPGIIFLKKRIQLTEALDKVKYLSLDLGKREARNHDIEQKELQIENDYLGALGMAPIDSLEKIDPKINDYNTIIMKQTQFIMADFISLARKRGYQWQ